MANLKFTLLTEDTTPTSDDLVATAHDPGGTPASKKVTLGNLTKGLSVMVGDSGSGGAKGLAPAPSAGDAAAGKFLKADGTYAVPPGTGTSGYATAQDEGSSVTQRSTMNFVGAGVTVTDDGSSKTVVTIPGGGSAADPIGHHQQVQALGSGASTTYGASAVGVNGSVTSAHDTTALFAQYTSGTGLNEDAGLVPNGGAFAHVRTTFTPIFYIKMKTGGTVTELRTWIGLFSEDPMASNTPAGHYVAFRFSTGASDTNWQAVSDDGGAAPTVTDTGVAHAANTVYTFKIDCSNPASIKFYINGSLVGTHTTNLPTTTQDLGWLAEVRNTGSTNAKVIRINRMVISMP